jgi:hypothetical protein
MSQIGLIKKYFKKWLKPLGLLWWEINISFYTDPSEIVEKFRQLEDGFLVVMKVDADWRYMRAYIAVNVPAFDGIGEEKIERAIVHELCHVLVNEARAGDIDHEERVVTALTNAFFWVEADALRNKDKDKMKNEKGK